MLDAEVTASISGRVSVVVQRYGAISNVRIEITHSPAPAATARGLRELAAAAEAAAATLESRAASYHVETGRNTL